jgi:protein involved in polysaccharide export with SLBB domain
MRGRAAFLVLFRHPLRAGPFFLAAAVFLSLAGCAHVDRELLADGGQTGRNVGVDENYAVSCPDELEVTVGGQPHWSGRRPIGPDGRIEVAPNQSVRVEGRTLPEVAGQVARQAGVAAGRVQVRVSQFNSRQLYLSGPGIGIQRTVDYRGRETVLDLLQRVGGITPAAASEDVYVVRSHVADGERPEVFHIDLQAIVMKKDQKTNVRIQAFDQVYVGETRQGKLGKCLPPWLRPLYQVCWGIRPRKNPVPIGPDTQAPRRFLPVRKDHRDHSPDLAPPAER